MLYLPRTSACFPTWLNSLALILLQHFLCIKTVHNTGVYTCQSIAAIETKRKNISPTTQSIWLLTARYRANCNRTFRCMNMGWKGLTTFRMTRDYEDNVLRRKLFVVSSNEGGEMLNTFWTMSRIKQSGFQRHFPYQNVLQNLRVRKWLENSQLFRTCENTAQELAENSFPQEENWQRKTLQWPRRRWERAGRLMWFWADKQPLWKTCYMELPSHSPFPGTVLQTQATPSLDPQASKQSSDGKRKNLRDPKHSFFSQERSTAVPTSESSNPNKTLLLQQHCFQLFRFLKGHPAENPQSQTAVTCNVQGCGSCLYCSVTDKFKT